MRRNSALLGVTAILCACFLIGSVVFIAFMRSQNEQENLQYLADSTSQTAAAVTQEIESNFQIMRGIAYGLGEFGIEETPQLQKLLQRINYSNSFTLMGIAQADGSAFWVDLRGNIYKDVNMLGQSYFTRAMAGTEIVTEMVYDELSDDYVNHYAVPISINGTQLGVLYAVNPQEYLSSITDVPVFHGSGFYTIINNNCRLVGPQPSNQPNLQPGTRLSEVFQIEQSTEEEKFCSAVHSGGSGHFQLNMDGQKHTVTLQPLETNGWFIISAVPSTVLDNFYNSTLVGSTILVFVASLIFIFLLFSQRRTLLKNKNELENLAYTDQLTGARNFVKFQLDGNALLEKDDGHHYTIWSLDIKQFKHLNTILGYQSGNDLLCEMARLLAAQPEENFLFCHVSADKFAGIAPWQDVKMMQDWFSAFVHKVNQFSILDYRKMHIDMSLGAYRVFADTQGETLDEMINHANIAKQFAKEKIGSHVSFFRIDIAERVRRENQLEAAANRALDNGEFTFYLQPKIAIQGGYKLTGAEALARWIDPELGIISPAEFIPLFEKNGFVSKLDRYIFEKVCNWYSGYLADGGTPLRISINVSRIGVLQDSKEFVEYYASIKKRYGIPDGLLELELTESVAMQDYELHYALTRRLQNSGFLCSIDDFGSGYSSLNVLKNLPVNIIKLDAVFFRETRDPDRARIVIAYFINMAGALGIRTVAEGVEAEEQVEFLQRIGCDVVQGYVFSKPLPVKEFELFAQNANKIELQKEA